MKFSKITRQHLQHYVYALVNPTNEKIFYVGKASGNNRAFEHLATKENESDKAKVIESIRSQNQEPRIDVLRYGLESESVAFEVEAAIIDVIGLENLTNKIKGHGTFRGRVTAKEMEKRHGCSPVKVSDIKEKCIVFYLRGSYSPSLSDLELYDCTRQFWTISKETREENKYKTALSVVDGIVVGVYSILGWFPAGATKSTREFGQKKTTKWEFVGQELKSHPLNGRILVDDNNQPIPNLQNGFSYIS